MNTHREQKNGRVVQMPVYISNHITDEMIELFLKGGEGMSNQKDLKGKTINGNKFICIVGTDKRGHTFWLCECSCGRLTNKRIDNIQKHCRKCAHKRSDGSIIEDITLTHTGLKELDFGKLKF